MDAFEKFKQLLDTEERELTDKIETLKRSLSRVQQKKANPEKYFTGGAKGVRLRRALGEEIPKRTPPTKKSETVPAAAPASETKTSTEEKKKGFGFFG